MLYIYIYTCAHTHIYTHTCIDSYKIYKCKKNICREKERREKKREKERNVSNNQSWAHWFSRMGHSISAPSESILNQLQWVFYIPIYCYALNLLLFLLSFSTVCSPGAAGSGQGESWGGRRAACVLRCFAEGLPSFDGAAPGSWPEETGLQYSLGSYRLGNMRIDSLVKILHKIEEVSTSSCIPELPLTPP